MIPPNTEQHEEQVMGKLCQGAGRMDGGTHSNDASISNSKSTDIELIRSSCGNDDRGHYTRPRNGETAVREPPTEHNIHGTHSQQQGADTQPSLTGHTHPAELQHRFTNGKQGHAAAGQVNFKKGTSQEQTMVGQTNGHRPCTGLRRKVPGLANTDYESRNDDSGDGESVDTKQGVNQSTGTRHLTLNDIDAHAIANNNLYLKKIFDMVAITNTPNYRAARIPLPSALNIRNWRADLVGYFDYNIVEFLEYGWPIGIDREATLQSTFENHASARSNPSDVTHYIATELGHKALLGPFRGPPTNACHFSPLMTRPKKGSVFRRVIIDLSWPQGRSVNDGISRTEYVDGPMTISLPTTDDMERAVVRAGKGSFLYKTDLSRGYRQLRVDPLDWPVLSFQHEYQCFMDICPPFGLRSSAMAMQRVSQAIVHLHGRRGFASKAYIDDFGGVESAEQRAAAALRALQGVMARLGVVQAEAKICLPSQRMVWLGIRFDTCEMSMAIPAEKLCEIMACLREWEGRLRATRKDMQSLLGLLNFVASVAPPARLFTNRMLDALREAPQYGATSLSLQFKQDVRFFVELLPIFNGRKIIGKQIIPYQHQVELDACLTGCGAVAGDQFYATPFPDSVTREEHTIAHLEMLNIVVAIKVWQGAWTGWTVQIYCDNLNSVQVLQSGKSRDRFMRKCAREVFLYTAAYDIDIQVCHRPGLQMIWADALSREHTDDKYAAWIRNDPHLSSATRVTVPETFFEIKNDL